MKPPILLAAVLAVSAAAAGASPKVKTTVGKDGVLRLPAAVVKKLGVKPGSDGLVCVQFPVSVLEPPKVLPPLNPKLAEPQDPPKVWLPLKDDGSLALVKTRLIPGNEYVPGAPGTVYFVRGEKGRLVLETPAKK
jgi:hypothetical protein